MVFDIGGVLAWDIWENVYLDPVKGLAVELDLDPKEIHQFGLGLWEEVAYRSAHSKAEILAMEASFWGRFMERFSPETPLQYFFDKADEFVRPVKGMLEIVRELYDRKFELGICSNNSEFFHKRLVAKLDLYRYFDPAKEILSSKIGASKTSPNYEMFIALEKALETPKEKTLFIDDRPANVERAIEYGFNALYFPPASERGAEYLRRLFSIAGMI